MVPDPQLPHWLAYLDVDAALSRFTDGDYVVTDAFTHRTVGAVGGSAWQMEEWSVRAVLVPLRRLKDAQSTLTHHDLGIEPSWIDRKRFDFGLSARIKGIPVRVWSYMRKHPATDQRLVEIQRDFVTYHALDQRGNGDEYELVHPLEGLAVVRVRIQKIAFYKPMLWLEVHRDYLRDYLAAAGLGLVIGAVSDRFRNTKTPDHSNPPPGQTPTDVEFSLQEVTDKQETYWSARSTLLRSVAIEPYGAPKPERSPWHCYDLPAPASNLEFIANSEGKTCFLGSCPPYLFFRAGVLRKYLKNPHDFVFFHMRSWGAAQDAGALESIDVGINSEGLVNASSWDLSKQKTRVQQYWSSFSCLPSGRICEDLFQTRMQQNPPDSPGTVEFVGGAISRLNEAFRSRFGDAVHSEIEPDEKARQRLSVGPLEDTHDELAELAKDLYAWVAEGLSTSALRRALGSTAYEKDWKQFKLIEQLMSKVLGSDPAIVNNVLGPLRDLNALRISHAHSLDHSPFTFFKVAGQRSRQMWFAVVDGIAGALDTITGSL